MKKSIVYVLKCCCLAILFCVNISNAQKDTKFWIDSLKSSLQLNVPIKVDSIFTEYYIGGSISFHLDSRRPRLNEAVSALDSILAMNSISSYVIPHLHSILVQFDARYVCEFSFVDDYGVLNVYHNVKSRDQKFNEFDMLGRLEQALVLAEILSTRDTMRLMNTLLGRNTDALKPQNSYSTTWRSFGGERLDLFYDFYRANKESFVPHVDDLLSLELTRVEAFRVLRLYGFFDKIPPAPVECAFFSDFEDRELSVEFINALEEYNNQWYQQDCIDQAISNYRRD